MLCFSFVSFFGHSRKISLALHVAQLFCALFVVVVVVSFSCNSYELFPVCQLYLVACFLQTLANLRAKLVVVVDIGTKISQKISFSSASLCFTLFHLIIFVFFYFLVFSNTRVDRARSSLRSVSSTTVVCAAEPIRFKIYENERWPMATVNRVSH